MSFSTCLLEINVQVINFNTYILIWNVSIEFAICLKSGLGFHVSFQTLVRTFWRPQISWWELGKHSAHSASDLYYDSAGCPSALWLLIFIQTREHSCYQVPSVCVWLLWGDQSFVPASPVTYFPQKSPKDVQAHKTVYSCTAIQNHKASRLQIHERQY